MNVSNDLGDISPRYRRRDDFHSFLNKKKELEAAHKR